MLTEPGLDRPCFERILNNFFAYFNIVFPSFSLLLFPFELLLMLSRNSQLHTACIREVHFCISNMQLTNGLKNIYFFFLVSYVREGHGGLYNASTKEERRKRKLRGERYQIKFIDLGFERWQVVRFREARERYDVP